MINSSNLSKLSKKRSFGIGRLFLLARRDFSRRLVKKMATPENPGSIPGHSLLPFIELEGTRSTELAKRAGVTKQAVVKALKELEKAGFVTKNEDPIDGRAQLVRFTEEGVTYLLRIHAAINSIEKEYEELIGTKKLEDLRQTLSLLAYTTKD